MIRRDDARAKPVAQPPDGVVLEVDVLGSQLDRFTKRRDSLGLGAGEAAALPRGAVGDDDAAGAVIEEQAQVRLFREVVKAQLGEVGDLGRERRDRPWRHGWWKT